MTGLFYVGQAAASDIDEVVAIERASSPTPWTEDMFADELVNPQRRYTCTREGSQVGPVVGFCGLWFAPDDAQIINIAVHPSARRRYVAARLMVDAASAARRKGYEALTLEVRASNRGALALYFRFGLAPIGVRPRYYTAPDLPSGKEDALILTTTELQTDAMADRLASIEHSIAIAVSPRSQRPIRASEVN